MSARTWLVILLLSVGCGAGQPRTRTELDAVRMQRAAALHAEQRAPELWREVKRAQAAAQAAGEDAEARADQMAIARLWLEATISECERADLAAKRLVVEREVDALNEGALRDQRAEAALSEKATHKAAAAIARREAALSLERAALSPVQRPKLDKASEASAARALLTRTQLVLESARALGADASALSEAESLSERARAALGTRPDLALDFADRALSRALMALGPVRAAEAEVSAAEKQALADDLEAAGAQLARDDRGLLATLEGVFGPGERLSATAERRLSRMCALAKAHPHGALRFTISAASAQAGTRKRELLSAMLEKLGCSGERFGIDQRDADSTAIELSWLAY